MVQHVAYEGLGSLHDSLARHGHRPRWARPQDDALRLSDARALIVLGGPMGVPDGFPRMTTELALIEAAMERELPILGICLGSQLISHALGARVTKGAAPEISWANVTRTGSHPLTDALPHSFVALHWHNDVFELPAKARSLWRSELTEHQAFAYGDRVLGLLFHLEATPAQVHEMAAAEPEAVPDRLLTDTALHAAAAREHGLAVFDRWCQLIDAPLRKVPSDF